MTTLNSTNSISSTFVDYSGLVNMVLFTTDVQSQSNDNFFKVSYNYSPCSVTTIIDGDQSIYNTTNFYIYGLLHTISGVTDGATGEFIIENISQLDGTKLYLCFLLKPISNKPTNDPKNGLLSQFLNNLITDGNNNYIFKNSNSTNKSINISPNYDQTIPNQTNCITYNDTTNNATIIIYTNPITYITGGDFDSYLQKLTKNKIPQTTTLFITNPTSQTDIITTNNIGMGGSSDGSSDNTNVITGTGDNNDIYIDCSKTGESEDTIKTYNIPINSDLMSDIQSSSLTKLITNFATFGILLLVCYIGIPKLYNAAVCDKLSDENQYYARIFISLYFIFVILGLFIQGATTNNMFEILIGFFFVFLAILTYILVLDIGTNSNDFEIQKLAIFIVEVFIYLFNPKNPTFWLIGFFVMFLCLTLYVKTDSDGNNMLFTNNGKTIASWLGIIFIPTISGLITWIAM